MFATALEFIMSQNGVPDIVHYLDDYFTCGPAQIDVCKSNLDSMLRTCKGNESLSNLSRIKGKVVL